MQAVTTFRRLLLLVSLLAFLPAASVYSGCSNPAGNEKDIIYNDEYHTYQFCDGTQWFSMGKPIASGGGGVAGGGYFVLSKTIYNGNFGSTRNNLDAPDAACLTELTTNTGWKGYPTANANGQIIAGKVHAFLCTDGVCNALIPAVVYYFANAGEVTAGGASFTTDSNGDGPNDSVGWNSTNYFNGDYIYWTGYRNPKSDSSWYDTPTGGGFQCKTTNSWDTGTNSANAVYGHSISTDKGRWWAGNFTCDQSQHLICYVNP